MFNIAFIHHPTYACTQRQNLRKGNVFEERFKKNVYQNGGKEHLYILSYK
jgi:hypothetical protein